MSNLSFKLLEKNQIENALSELPQWKVENNAITRTFALPSFAEAISFVNRIADLAENYDHHPDITINYKKVTLSYSTHSKGGITGADVELARLSSELV